MTVTLKPLVPADHEELIALLSHNGWPYHGDAAPDHGAATKAVASGRYTQGEDDAPYWIVVEGERVGVVVLHELGDPTPVFDLRLVEAHRGRGLGAGVLAALAREVFEPASSGGHGKHRLEGHTRADNLAMRHVFEKADWELEAYYRQAWPERVDGAENGVWHDAVAYALLASDWRKGTRTRVSLDPVRA